MRTFGMFTSNCGTASRAIKARIARSWGYKRSPATFAYSWLSSLPPTTIQIDQRRIESVHLIAEIAAMARRLQVWRRIILGVMIQVVNLKAVWKAYSFDTRMSHPLEWASAMKTFVYPWADFIPEKQAMLLHHFSTLPDTVVLRKIYLTVATNQLIAGLAYPLVHALYYITSHPVGVSYQGAK